MHVFQEERKTNSLQIGTKIMTIGLEIRKIWHFEISIFVGKHFLTSPNEYWNEWISDVMPSQFDIYIIHEIVRKKNHIFGRNR